MGTEEIDPINELVKFLNAGWKIELIPDRKIGGYVSAKIRLTPPDPSILSEQIPIPSTRGSVDFPISLLFGASFDLYVEGDFAKTLHELRLRFNPRPKV